jgi:hypothetical protein
VAEVAGDARGGGAGGGDGEGDDGAAIGRLEVDPAIGAVVVVEPAAGGIGRVTVPVRSLAPAGWRMVAWRRWPSGATRVKEPGAVSMRWKPGVLRRQKRPLAERSSMTKKPGAPESPS